LVPPAGGEGGNLEDCSTMDTKAKCTEFGETDGGNDALAGMEGMEVSVVAPIPSPAPTTTTTITCPAEMRRKCVHVRMPHGPAMTSRT